MRKRLAAGRALSIEDYRTSLRRRAEIREQYARLSARYDAVVSLGAIGAAPAGLDWTGDPAINVPASLLGTPAITLPLLADDNLPLGLQLIGRADEDADVMVIAGWLWLNYDSVQQP
jgi:Asp-tRNA(Asn)/Glu-tRNA(Gln) amidotransferase A subunit family amidase